MPLYEYECKKCHHRFEKIQSFSAPHTKKCPKCKGPIEQVITAPAVQFKGSGWYVTDYAKGNSSGSSSSGNNDSSKDSGKDSDEKSESKSKSDEKSKSDDKPKAEKSEKPEKKKAEKK
jgi:putative FmdB family regulatory protein